MQSLRQLGYKIKISAQVLFRAVWHGYYPAVFVGLFFLVLFILQWLFEYEQFYEVIIVNQAMQTVIERINYLIDALESIFRYPDDLTPVALIVIAFFQAAIITVWFRTREIKKSRTASATALGLGLFGAGCVACASSLTSVIFSSLGSAASVSLVSAIGDILLVLAVILSIKAFMDLAISTSGYFNEQT